MAGMDSGTSRSASGEEVVVRRRVNENDFDASGMNPNRGTNQLVTCEKRRRRTEGSGEQKL